MGSLDVCSLKHGHKKIAFKDIPEILKDECKKELILTKLQMKYRLSARLGGGKKKGRLSKLTGNGEETQELANGAEGKVKDMGDLEEVLEKHKDATDLLLLPPVTGG